MRNCDLYFIAAMATTLGGMLASVLVENAILGVPMWVCSFYFSLCAVVEKYLNE